MLDDFPTWYRSGGDFMEPIAVLITPTGTLLGVLFLYSLFAPFNKRCRIQWPSLQLAFLSFLPLFQGVVGWRMDMWELEALKPLVPPEQLAEMVDAVTRASQVPLTFGAMVAGLMGVAAVISALVNLLFPAPETSVPRDLPTQEISTLYFFDIVEESAKSISGLKWFYFRGFLILLALAACVILLKLEPEQERSLADLFSPAQSLVALCSGWLGASFMLRGVYAALHRPWQKDPFVEKVRGALNFSLGFYVLMGLATLIFTTVFALALVTLGAVGLSARVVVFPTVIGLFVMFWFGSRYFLALPLMLERDLPFLPALKWIHRNFKIKNSTCFGIFVVLVLLYQLSILTLGLGFIFVWPMSFLAIGILYREGVSKPLDSIS